MCGHYRTLCVWGAGTQDGAGQFRLAPCGSRRAEVRALAGANVSGDERYEVPGVRSGVSEARPEIAEAEGVSGRRLPRRPVRDPAQDCNPLQRLIRQRLDEQGWYYGDVSKRGGLPRSTVYSLA